MNYNMKEINIKNDIYKQKEINEMNESPNEIQIIYKIKENEKK